VKDEQVTVKIVTPGGLILSIDPDYVPVDSVRDNIRAGNDEGAANHLRNLTACPVTIERLHLTTARPD
jgi:hypothetical protein